MLIRKSGRSTDFISPSFGYGCLFNCTYCYMKRHKPDGLDIAINPQDILSAINSHAAFAEVDKPNQTHPEYITYDISCNEDFALHAKYHQWMYIFEFFKTSDNIMGSFATKYVNENLLSYNPNEKIRIRFSLMPQSYSTRLEANTSSIIDRIKAIDRFIDAGYDVHINFSPVIVTDDWINEYIELFKLVNDNVKNKDKVKAEVIFLTHNKERHEFNMKLGLYSRFGEDDLLWRPDIQVDKVSEYGGNNIRYKDKYLYVEQFKQLHEQIIPWNTIRYIF
jgi:spore photoproduct lyase